MSVHYNFISFDSVISDISYFPSLIFRPAHTISTLPATFQSSQCQIRMCILRLKFQYRCQYFSCLAPCTLLFERSSLREEVSDFTLLILCVGTSIARLAFFVLVVALFPLLLVVFIAVGFVFRPLLLCLFCMIF